MANTNQRALSPEMFDILKQIFFPKSQETIDEINQKPRFAHYTSAETATKMIKNREWWFRDPSCMNDSREVHHGLQCIERNLDSGSLKIALDNLYPNLANHILYYLNQAEITPTRNSYIGCISKHGSTEDEHGRLSMWRAYGKGNGVAIVLNSDPILNSPGVLKLTTHKVYYEDHREITRSLITMASEISNHQDNLRTLHINDLMTILISNFRELALITKHPGFKEEQEWRLIYDDVRSPSPHMKKSIEVINGVTQTIYKAPLRPTDNGESTGAELPKLIDRIIIGPTQYPKATKEAFIHLLAEAEVPDPHQKVIISGIPLRT